ncbi:unnamed protein product [Victoria cruziana]
MEGEKSDLCVTLRPFELADASDVMAWAADDRVACWCRWDALRSGEEAQFFVESRLMAHPWARAICLDGRPVGQLTFKQGADVERCRGEIGYAVAHRHWGKGVATRALKLAVSDIFREFPEIKRIDAVAVDSNVGSLRVLEKGGFAREGLLRKYRLKEGETLDMFVYSILASS